MTILKRPNIGRPARLDASTFDMGSRAKVVMTQNGSPIWDSSKIPLKEKFDGYDCVWARMDIEIGIDKIPTLTPSLVGWDSARYLKDKFKRGDKIDLTFSFQDVTNKGIGTVFERKLFSGELIQALPAISFPGGVDLQIDGLSYKMRENDASTPYKEDSPISFIGTMLNEIGLTPNVDGEPIEVSGDSTQNKDNDTILDYVNRYCQASGIHWTDTMDGGIFFFFPNGRGKLLGQSTMDWVIPLKGRRDTNASTGRMYGAFLDSWQVQENFVDIPGKIIAPWFKPGDTELSATLDPVIVDVTFGKPEHVYHTSPIMAEDAETVRKLVESQIMNYLSLSITGEYALKVGLPILPMDDIAAVDVPPGLEEYGNLFFRVTDSHLTFDASGLKNKGGFRAIPNE